MCLSGGFHNVVIFTSKMRSNLDLGFELIGVHMNLCLD